MKHCNYRIGLLAGGLSLTMLFVSCMKDDKPGKMGSTFSVENVLMSRSLVESGTFKGAGAAPVPPVIFPGQEISIRFSAGKGQALSFATMYGWSNDLFFAPANPGISLFDDNGMPIEGDVSAQIRLWDNGTRMNQAPGMGVSHPGTAQNGPVMEVNGTDAQGNTYLAASQLMKGTLKYEGNSVFTFTIRNISGGTANETPFSPGVWAVSNMLGGNLLNAAPLYESGKPTANGLTMLAEAGDNSVLADYLEDHTKIFTPLSPVLIVVYNSKENPLYTLNEKDRGKGLADIAQKGDATALQQSLMSYPGVKKVYVVKAATTTVLLPFLGDDGGGRIEQQIEYAAGDRITFATMFGYSNDWFYSFGDEGVSAAASGDLTNKVKLLDNGTAVDQYPGAGNSQGAFGGMPQTSESKPIQEVGMEVYPVPAVNEVIRVKLMK
jgi:hypothetical protein